VADAQASLETFAKKFIGRNDIGDALKRLDKFTQEEAQMAIVENLKVSNDVKDNIDDMKRSSSLELVVISLIERSYREAAATGPSKVALSIRSVHKPQYCPQVSPSGHNDVVLPNQYL
jgi:hypothetical protein